MPSYDITSVDDYNRYKKDQERKNKMPLKIQQTITKEYQVMLYCKETNETKEATLQDLQKFICEESNYNLNRQLSDLEYDNITLTKLTEKLSKENLELKNHILLLSTKQPYEYMPWDYRKPFEFTCRTEHDTYDYNPGINVSESTVMCNEYNGHCCDTLDVKDIQSQPLNIDSQCEPVGTKSGFIKYGSEE